MYITIAAAALAVFLLAGITHKEPFLHWLPTAIVGAILWPLIVVGVIIYLWRTPK